MYSWLVIDGMSALTAAVLLLILGVNNPVLLAICGFVAMSPDLSWLYYGLKGNIKKIHKHDYLNKFHSWIQWYQKPPGLIVEFCWAALMVFITIRLQ